MGSFYNIKREVSASLFFVIPIRNQKILFKIIIVKRAADLLAICNAKLKLTESEVNKIIENIKSKE